MEDSQFTKLLTAVTSLESRITPAISSDNVAGQMALATISDMREFLTASIQTPYFFQTLNSNAVSLLMKFERQIAFN